MRSQATPQRDVDLGLLRLNPYRAVTPRLAVGTIVKSVENHA